MRLYWIPLLIALVVNIAIDVFIYKRLRQSVHFPKWARFAHATGAVVLYGMLGMASYLAHQPENESLRIAMYLLAMFYSVQAIKVTSLCIYALSWLKRCGSKMKRLWRATSALVGLAMVALIVWGMAVTPFTFEVRNVTIESSRLPSGFDGYRIAQFSDTHLGFYGTDTTYITQVVDSINALKPDLICFTGDLVNRQSHEADPFVSVLRRLKAKDGVVSIRGNHDDRMYYHWANDAAWEKDSLRLEDLERKMGWRLLVDEHYFLHHGGDSILVMGMRCLRNGEGEGGGLYRQLQKTYPAFKSDSTHYRLMLQHGSTPWKWMKAETWVDLMLAGHTHGMQMELRLFGKRISPAVFLYPQWGGLYESEDGSEQQIYVNIGIGQVGMPMRIGASIPEITLITLKTKK